MPPSTKIKNPITYSEESLLRAELDAANRMIRALRMKIEALSIENDTLKAENDTINRSIDTTKGITDTIKGGIGTIPNDNNTTTSKIDTINSNTDTSLSNTDTNRNNNDTTSRNTDTISRNNDTTKRIETLVKKAIQGQFYYDRVPERLVKEIIVFLDRGEASLDVLTRVTGMSLLTVKRDMAILRKLKWVVFKGSRRNGAYSLTDEAKSLFSSLPE